MSTLAIGYTMNPNAVGDLKWIMGAFSRLCCYFTMVNPDNEPCQCLSIRFHCLFFISHICSFVCECMYLYLFEQNTTLVIWLTHRACHKNEYGASFSRWQHWITWEQRLTAANFFSKQIVHARQIMKKTKIRRLSQVTGITTVFALFKSINLRQF